jgi:pSer/pThr/pTyr-binding forkhead associated (FHA) protein
VTEPLCASCGTRFQRGTRFCGHCGNAVASPATPRHGDAPPARPPGADLRAAAARIRLALVRNDGAAGRIFSVAGEQAVCGRTEGEILLPDDPTVSPRHARFTAGGGALRVEDLGSVNGTFIRLRGPRRIAAGDELRIGRQLLRLEPLPRPAHADERDVRAWGTADPGYRYRLSQLLDGGGPGEIFPLRDGENVVGREAGEVSFPSDRYVSALHARIRIANGELTLADAGSSNGTFVKIAGAVELSPGDQLLVGAQLLRVE